jgi:hypothetical protein
MIIHYSLLVFAENAASGSRGSLCRLLLALHAEACLT